MNKIAIFAKVAPLTITALIAKVVLLTKIALITKIAFIAKIALISKEITLNLENWSYYYVAHCIGLFGQSVLVSILTLLNCTL